MGRSPSPRRRDDRRREDRRERERRRPRTRSRSRSLDRRRRSPDRRRSPSPRRRRSNSPSPIPSTSFVRQKKPIGERPIITPADLEGKTPEEQEMLKVMGFCGFDTTKGKKVDGNVEGDVHVVLKRKYRQYMNRKGGFNRPLDFVA
ncbi:U4/U6.U5 small nuclear ribonucleoprotein 27 kDa protein [Bombyx mandarina]|uniref:U4/U6.U5 small nuclear ribonucleoprotein 27 kDa protein n=2 Tax=Bombyx TaxID=7090 RepID=A0A8R2G8Y6_BOMMO|nr:U4/U6.U5 small nuclear ribonucleoprotein 27 kDa protein [Bombyx mori]XP_028037488.1 U4/U6.U5 small nuclear ribonucleoprotein 27 kDa protein [Bombyx mandarina]